MNSNIAHPHPITLLTDKICRIFTSMGFDIADGPEMEREWYNFDALNVPKDHPSRDMQDTFFLQLENDQKLGNVVLRTHTSNVQTRYMESISRRIKQGEISESEAFPLAIVVPGKVYRNEATDATHEAQFYQLEGLLIGNNISLAHLKGTLEKFFTELFDREIKVRMRSSFFPFVEPGVEIDMQCFKCDGKGYSQDKTTCSLCKQTGWIEIGGAGLVHPNVLNNCGIDSRQYSGFAFGMGMDRIIMMRYGIADVRLLYNGDLRVVNQF